ncbi:MAG: SRPBCC family protein [Thermoleophilia bacterium]|nr:SRPBCC family protein [Thermoleophilia bacterium]
MSAESRTVRRAVALSAPPERVYAFHLDTRNAASMAPPGFRMDVVDGRFPLVEGAHVTVRMRQRPLPGTALWELRVAELVPGARMVDEAVRSPFARWSHAHAFHGTDGGTTMTDTITYALPGGRTVNAVAGPVVDRMLRAALAYRHRRTARAVGAAA